MRHCGAGVTCCSGAGICGCYLFATVQINTRANKQQKCLDARRAFGLHGGQGDRAGFPHQGPRTRDKKRQPLRGKAINVQCLATSRASPSLRCDGRQSTWQGKASLRGVIRRDGPSLVKPGRRLKLYAASCSMPGTCRGRLRPQLLESYASNIPVKARNKSPCGFLSWPKRTKH
jgi:hypothetical protein